MLSLPATSVTLPPTTCMPPTAARHLLRTLAGAAGVAGVGGAEDVGVAAGVEDVAGAVDVGIN